jgi:nitrogen fixation/metabolism regulation signal transduction histidine kinase
MAQALAHEVQNPLTPIQLTVEAMRKRYHGDDRAYAALLDECSRIVVQEVESLRSLVLCFREFSRPVEPLFAPIDLNAIVADVGALQHDLRVELDLSAELGPIRADEDRLRPVLMNDEQPNGDPRTWREAREAYERVFIRAALARHGGKIARAAEELGFERTHLHKRLRELGMREEGL